MVERSPRPVGSPDETDRQRVAAHTTASGAPATVELATSGLVLAGEPLAASDSPVSVVATRRARPRWRLSSARRRKRGGHDGMQNRHLPTQSPSASTPLRPGWTLDVRRAQLSRCRRSASELRDHSTSESDRRRLARFRAFGASGRTTAEYAAPAKRVSTAARGATAPGEGGGQARLLLVVPERYSAIGFARRARFRGASGGLARVALRLELLVELLKLPAL